MSHTLSMDTISKTTHITVVTTLKSNLRSPMSNPYLLNVHLKIKERISSSLIPPRKEFMKFWLGKLVPFLVKYMPSYILLFLQSSLVYLIIQYPDQAWATFTVAHIPWHLCSRWLLSKASFSASPLLVTGWMKLLYCWVMTSDSDELQTSRRPPWNICPPQVSFLKFPISRPKKLQCPLVMV